MLVVGRDGFEAGDGRLALPRVSSTEVRAALAAGRPVDGLVPRAVLDYIREHDLYLYRGGMSDMAEVDARAMADGPADAAPSVFIMGAGVVGTALAVRLVGAGVTVTGLHGRQVELTDAARASSRAVWSARPAKSRRSSRSPTR